ncbi:MAG: serine/threonine-protein kinase [Sandaracinaceae bacterium]
MTHTPPATKKDRYVGLELPGRYKFVRRIGTGGMGAVYEGEHLLIGRRVAIKVLHARFAEDPEIVRRFLREARVAATVAHPNIVEVTDMGELDDGAPYMVLEFLEGRDFGHDIREQGPQPPDKLARIMSQACDALTAAHQRDIIHRDLKPENIYLTNLGGDAEFVKLLDFGISKILADGDHRLTKTGAALGTPYYMSPEQCRGDIDVDARLDIYAMGVVMYQALTGRVPYDHDSYPMLVMQIMQAPVPEVKALRPDVPDELNALVRRMMDKFPEGRPGSCEEVRRLLQPFRTGSSSHVRLSTTHPVPRGVVSPAPTPEPPSSPSQGTLRLPDSVPETDGVIDTAPLPSGPELEAQPDGIDWRVVGAIAVLAILGSIAGLFGALVAGPGDDEEVTVVADKDPVAPKVAVPPPVVEAPARVVAEEPSPTASNDAANVDPTPDPNREEPDPNGEEANPERAGAVEMPAPTPPVEPAHEGEPAPAEQGEPGHLTVTAIPFGEIFVDGRAAGRDRAHVTVPPGRHRIRVVRGGTSRSRSVDVEPGGRASVTVRL